MKKLFVVAVVLFAMSACGGKAASPDQEISKMDIVGAESLFIAKSDGGLLGSSNKAIGDVINRLFKIMPDGYVEEVIYLDSYGNPATSVKQPSAIITAGNDYLIIMFDVNYAYLVKKSDGAAYGMGYKGTSHLDEYFIGSPVAVTDKNGAIYFYDHDGVGARIYKITNLDISPTLELYTSEADEVTRFTVDNDGNLFYGGNNHHDEMISRVKKLNGELENLSSSIFWRGADGQVYLQSYDNTRNRYQIKRVSIDQDYNLVETNYGEFSTSSIVSSPFSYSSSYIFNFSDKVSIISNGYQNTQIVDFKIDSNEPVITDLGEMFFSIITAKGSNEHYYIAGTNNENNDIIKKCSVLDNVCSDLLTAGDFEIYTMSVSNSDEVTFNALRMSDGAKIIAKVDGDGVVTVLDAQLDVEITVLERIN